MARRRQGQFATFAMLIPMFAIPVMAVFGIPQFAPVVASPSGQSQPEWLADGSFPDSGQSAAFSSRALNLVAAEADQLDLFEPYPEAASSASPGTRDLTAAERWTNPLQSGRSSDSAEFAAAATTDVAPRAAVLDLFAAAAAGDTVASPQMPPESLAGARSIEDRSRPVENSLWSAEPSLRSAPSSPSSSQPVSRSRVAAQPTGLSWRVAVERLNQLGIRTYRLSPSASAGRYYFMCLVTSADDPRISRRFEAEAGDPLDAVDSVLAQVEDWNRVR